MKSKKKIVYDPKSKQPFPAKWKTFKRKCSECGKSFKQEVIDYGDQYLTTDDYDEFCEDCNKKAMR